MRPARARDAVHERGDTLIEILVAVTILGVAFIAVLAGLATAINLSDRHRGQTSAGVVILGAADSVKNQAYVACPTATVGSYSASSGVVLPARWTTANLTISAIKFRNGTAWSTTCPGTDQNVQLITITATAPSGGAIESIDVVKRKAS